MVSAFLIQTGKIIKSAGSVVTENNHAAIIPIEVRLPRSRKGGESLKFMERNPITVVKLVRNTAR